MPLAKKSNNRSAKFPSRTFIASKFKNKFLFKNFTKNAFENYIKHGFYEAEDGMNLRFKKDIENINRFLRDFIPFEELAAVVGIINKTAKTIVNIIEFALADMRVNL